MADAHGSFHYRGHRIVYDVHGEGDRALVLIHGLLMNRRMYDRLAPEMAERGNRVITVDLLGHGESDKPDDMRIYSMSSLASQAAALVDHLGLQAPVVGRHVAGRERGPGARRPPPRERGRAVHRDAGARGRAAGRCDDLHADPR